MKNVILSCALLSTTGAMAAPVSYEIDPHHTYPSFEVDHMGGLSTFLGKFDQTSGKIVLDREKKAGTVEVTVDATSFNIGYDKLNTHVKSKDMLDVEKFPTATFKGRFTGFKGDVPTEVAGDFTLHGVTRPLTLTIERFLCKPRPMTNKEACGAAASAHFDRADFGVDYGKAYGFSMDVRLIIQVEAERAG